VRHPWALRDKRLLHLSSRKPLSKRGKIDFS